MRHPFSQDYCERHHKAMTHCRDCVREEIKDVPPPPDLNDLLVAVKKKHCACNLASGPGGWNIWVGKVGHRIKYEADTPLAAVKKALEDHAD